MPVRYPAVAVAGNAIYLFGGETASGRPTDAVQAIDPAAGTARVVAHLPQPASHASAVDLGRPYLRARRDGGRLPYRPHHRVRPRDPGIAPGGRAAVARVERRRGGRRRLRVSDRGPRQGRDPARLRGPAHAEERHAPARPSPVHRSTTTTSGTTSTSEAAANGRPAFRGRMLIADRGNNRLLLVNAEKRVLWRYPGPGGRPRPVASTSPTTPSSPTAARGSSPTRSRTSASCSWPSRPAR